MLLLRWNRSTCFHPEGLCLYASAVDALKVYGWEPSRCYDSLPTGWGRGADITIAKNQLVSAVQYDIQLLTFSC